tara:strand:+ start:209 stop:337 length:129 start_codon:yes stop_codon:yes gene_type:complete
MDKQCFLDSIAQGPAIKTKGLSLDISRLFTINALNLKLSSIY